MSLHHVQPLPTGGFLVASARCRFCDGDPERNGRNYDSAGNLEHSITLGDGIQAIRVAKDGTIWASYYDEGVFGNLGWSEPLGASGLVAWTLDGARVFEFRPTAGLETICDCYAMNLSDSELWIYYYTDFPLVRIRDHEIVNHWRVPVSGADAFAVSGSHALFRGGYQRQDRYELIALTVSQGKAIGVIELRDIEGRRLVAERAIGAADRMFLQRGSEIFRLTVALALDASGQA